MNGCFDPDRPRARPAPRGFVGYHGTSRSRPRNSSPRRPSTPIGSSSATATSSGPGCVSKKHLQRYLDEHDFKYNSKDIADGARMLLAIQGVEGRRLTLFQTKAGSSESLIGHRDGDELPPMVEDGGEDLRQGRLPRSRPGRKKRFTDV